MATIIKGQYVYTPEGFKADWGVRIVDNKIAEVGPNESLTVEAGDVVEDAGKHVILPGFVNGHNHMYGFLSHGITLTGVKVTEFSSFLDDYWWPYIENRVTPEIAVTTAEMAAVEMIDSGVTSFVDILEGPYSIPGSLEAMRDVIDKAGLRGRLSFEACQRISEENGQLGLKENYDFIKAHNGERVDGVMSIHTLFTCDEKFVKQAKEMADEAGAPMHMHLSESVFEPTWCAEHYGKKPVDIYKEWGCLDGNILASQCVQIDEEEIEAMAQAGARAISMPISNCEVGGGFAPISKMLDKGMIVGLGTDGYVNNFFEVMRGAFLMHKANQQDPGVMPATRVLDMATRQGAIAIGKPEVGTLEAGKLADVICVRIDTTPTPCNTSNLYDQLVLFRNPADVDHVMIDGSWVKKEGKLLTLDADDIKARMRETAAKFWAVNEA